MPSEKFSSCTFVIKVMQAFHLKLQSSDWTATPLNLRKSSSTRLRLEGSRWLMPRSTIEPTVLSTERPLRSWRWCRLIVRLEARRLFGLSDKTKSEVANREATEDQYCREDHSFVANGLDKRIEYFGESMCTDLRASNPCRILVHTLLPVATDGV